MRCLIWLAGAVLCWPLSTVSLAQAQSTDIAAPAAGGRTSRVKREPTARELASRERLRKCGGEWREAKAKGATAGQKWPQYWSKCNARLKGNSA